nr:basic salivary proline-rich protein 2-like [Delphinus delphis]
MEGSQSEGHGLIANIKAAPASPSNCTFPPAPRRPPCPELSAGTSPPPACLFLRPPPVQFSQRALTMSTPQPPAPPPWDLASPSPARSPLCRPTGPIHAGTPRSQGALQTPPRPSQAPLLPVGVRAQTMNKRQAEGATDGHLWAEVAWLQDPPLAQGSCSPKGAQKVEGFPSPHFPPALETVGSQGLQPAGGPCAAVTTLRSQGQRSRKEASLRAQQPLSLAPLGALSARGPLDTALPMRGLWGSRRISGSPIVTTVIQAHGGSWGPYPPLGPPCGGHGAPCSCAAAPPGDFCSGDSAVWPRPSLEDSLWVTEPSSQGGSRDSKMGVPGAAKASVARQAPNPAAGPPSQQPGSRSAWRGRAQHLDRSCCRLSWPVAHTLHCSPCRRSLPWFLFNLARRAGESGEAGAGMCAGPAPALPLRH